MADGWRLGVCPRVASPACVTATTSLSCISRRSVASSSSDTRGSSFSCSLCSLRGACSYFAGSLSLVSSPCAFPFPSARVSGSGFLLLAPSMTFLWTVASIKVLMARTISSIPFLHRRAIGRGLRAVPRPSSSNWMTMAIAFSGVEPGLRVELRRSTLA